MVHLVRKLGVEASGDFFGKTEAERVFSMHHHAIFVVKWLINCILAH